MKYVVLYTSEGQLSGRQVGDKVTISDDMDAAHLLALGLIAPANAARPAPSGEETEEERARQLKAEQDQQLAPFARGGGWYHFAPETEGGAPTRRQGRDAALEYLAQFPGAKPHAAADAPD